MCFEKGFLSSVVGNLKHEILQSDVTKTAIGPCAGNFAIYLALQFIPRMTPADFETLPSVVTGDAAKFDSRTAARTRVQG